MRFTFVLALALLIAAATAHASDVAVAADGAYDFDFEIGTWNIAPSGGVHVVRKIWNGGASIAELFLQRPSPHFAGSLLRFYDPQSHKWRIYWIGSKRGSVDPALVGAFANGRGEFIGSDVRNGTPILDRLVYSDITPSSFRTEQSFSTDGGRTWQTNLIQTFTRAGPLRENAVLSRMVGDSNRRRDFDFEFGTWRVHLHRLLHPLTGSTAWTDLDGTSVLRRLWGGAANFGELDVANATTRIEGFTLRVYDPVTQQWSVYFVSRRDPELGTPTVGRFTRGRGEFYDREPFNGKAVVVRFVFDEITAAAFRFVQSFSADGGRTWEANWIADFTRS
jgi:hypothetical protein